MVTCELHRHFEAGLSPDLIARLAARHGITAARTRSGATIEGLDPQDPTSIRAYYAGVAAGFASPGGAARFLDSFGLPLSVMRTLDDLEEAVVAQLRDCADSGSLHTELRGSPFSYQEHVQADTADIAAALVSGVDRAWRDDRVSGTFILAFSRQKGLPGSDPRWPDGQAGVVAALAAALHRPDRPVGLDIAGFPELPYPPRAFAEALSPAREAGVPLTVHGGEQGRPPGYHDAPPDSVAEAITVLGATRIGHGTAIAGSDDVMALVRDRGIVVESCPVSNHLMGFDSLPTHPIRRFLREGIHVTLSTDDPLMFGTPSVAAVWQHLVAAGEWTPADLGRLTRHAVEGAFVTPSRRRELLDRLGQNGDTR